SAASHSASSRRIPPRLKTCSSRSPGGSCAMHEPMMHEPTTAGRSWRDSAPAQLTLVRFREYLREPEAVFWTFIFPILMTAGLGIALRRKPTDHERCAALADAPSAAETAQRLKRDSLLDVQVLGDSAAARALRT